MGIGQASHGVLSLMGAAAEKRGDEGFDFSLAVGDLCTMAAMKSFLQDHGIEVGQNDVYPSLREADVRKALRLIWDNRVKGWDRLVNHMVERRICTRKQADDAWKQECGRLRT